MDTVSIIPRQLAPTVGPEASRAQIRTGSPLGGIGESVDVGVVNYFGNIPYIIPDATWTPASSNLTNSTIVPFRGFDIFIGWSNLGVSSFETDYMTGPTLEAEIAVEDRSRSALPVDASGLGHYHFVGYVSSGSGSTKAGDRSESILNAIDEEADSEDGSKSADHEDDDYDGSPFRRKIEAVYMTV